MSKTIPVMLKLTTKQMKYLKDNPDSLKGIIRATNGQIKCHVDIASNASSSLTALKKTGKVIQVASKGLEPATGAINLVSNVAQNVQLHKLQKTTERVAEEVQKMSKKVDVITNLSWLNTGLSVVNIGVTVASTYMICKKMNNLTDLIKENQVILNNIDRKIDQIQIYQFENLYRDFKSLDQQMSSIIDNYRHSFSEGRFDNIYNLSDVEKVIAETNALIESITLLLLKQMDPYEQLLNMLSVLLTKFAMCIQLYVTVFYYTMGRFPNLYERWLNTIDSVFDKQMCNVIYDYYRSNPVIEFRDREVLNLIGVAKNEFSHELAEDVKSQILLVQFLSKEQYIDTMTNILPQIGQDVVEEYK